MSWRIIGTKIKFLPLKWDISVWTSNINHQRLISGQNYLGHELSLSVSVVWNLHLVFKIPEINHDPRAFIPTNCVKPPPYANTSAFMRRPVLWSESWWGHHEKWALYWLFCRTRQTSVCSQLQGIVKEGTWRVNRGFKLSSSVCLILQIRKGSKVVHRAKDGDLLPSCGCRKKPPVHTDIRFGVVIVSREVL